MRIALRHGTGRVVFDVPDERVAGPWSLASVPAAPARPDALEAALAELEAAGLARAVRGRRLGLLLSDGTRHEPRERVLPALLPRLRGAREVLAFVATGTHDPALPENVTLARELRARLDAAGLAARLVVHDARDGAHVLAGTTARGTRVELDARAASCDAFLAVSDMKHHYFAGYSHPVKALVPGIASFETARGNHALALAPGAEAGRHPWHPDPAQRGNPLAEDLVDAWRIGLGGRPDFALATFTGVAGAIAWAGGGATRDVASRGMAAVDERAGLAVEPVRRLVVSAGGHPLDESLYTAQRALELSRAALVAPPPAGPPACEVLFLARCPNGIGPASSRENFFERLARPLPEVLASFGGEYAMYSHKAYKLATYLGLARLLLLSDLPAEDVRRIHVEPVDDPTAVVAGWLERLPPGERIGFLDDGSVLALRPGRAPAARPGTRRP